MSMDKVVKKVLTWSQEYTRTDMNYLVTSGFWTVCKYVFLVISGLVTTIALANFIDPDTYGTYQYVLSVAGILGMFTLTGMDYAINRAVAQGRDGAFRYGVRIKLIWSAGISITAAFVAGYYFLNNDEVLAVSILIAGTLSPLMVSFQLYEHYLSGRQLFKHDTQIEIVRKFLPLLSLLVALYHTENIIILTSTYFVSNTISYVLAYTYVVNHYRPPLERDIDTIKFSKHLSTMRIVGTITAHADKILIWHFLGATSVAVFTLAQLATKYSGGILSAITAVAIPKLAVRDLASLQQSLPRKIYMFSFIMGLAALIYYFISPLLFSLLFPMYPEAIPLTRALAITLLFVPFSLYQKALMAHAQTYTLYIINILLPVIKLGLLIALLPVFQIWGAVYATILSGLLGSILLSFLFAKSSSA